MLITKRLARALLESIVSHPKMVLSIFLLCTGMLGWQARYFRIDASADTLLLKNNKDYIQTQIVNRRFAPQEFLLVAYKPKNSPVFSEMTFRNLRTLSAKLRRLNRVQSVRSILNVPVLSKMTGDLTSHTDLSNMTMEKQGFSIAQLKKAFAGNPVYEDLLINKTQKATALQVLFKTNKKLEALHNRIIDLRYKAMHHKLVDTEQKELSRLNQRAETIEMHLDKTRNLEIETIRRIIKEYENDAEIYLGGLHVLGYQLIRIIKSDLIVFGSAIAAMICLVLFFLFRMARWVIIPVGCCVCSVISTMGLFGLFDLKTTVISSNFISLQLILTLAIVIHMIVQYREYNASHPDWNQTELVKQTLLKKAGPCFYAGITTAVGFGSLIFSNIQPIITFGWMMIIAICFSICVSLILFPAMMVMFRREQAVDRGKLSTHILNSFKWLTLKHSALIAVSGGCIFAGTTTGLFRLNVENSFINYFRDSTRVHKELSFIDQQFGGSTPLDLVYTIPRAHRKKDLVITADTVQMLQRIQQALKQHRGVGKILSIVNFTELAKALNAGRPLTEYELTTLYWTMGEALRSELLGSFFSPEHAQVRFAVRIKDTTKGLRRAELISDIRNDMKTLSISDDRYMLTNLFVLYQDILQRLFRSQILTLGIVFGVLTLTFYAIFKSVKIALVGIAPNILSTLAVLGVMGWLAIPLDLMTITIAAIAMGIAVDDTIHYIHRYLEELRDVPAEKAIDHTYGSVGYAILYTSFIIILGFSLLIFSDFVPSVLFGLLTGLAMAAALVFDLTILPAMLNKLIKSA